MKFSILTPTIQRPSLVRCCQSVSEQTFKNFEHIIQVDCADYDMALITQIEEDPRRAIYKCPSPHHNFGNTCRGLAWDLATGDWCLYLDCDNYLADSRVLEDLSVLLTYVEEKWTLWPILRHGRYFFYDPPGTCRVDTANLLLRREIARWPNRDEYTLDGIFCEELLAKYPYMAFPDFRPIVVMEESRQGR